MVLISEKWTRQLLFSELFSTRPFLRNLTLSLSFPLTRFSLDVSKAQLICWWNSLLVLLWICSHYCRANEQRAARERFYYHLKRKNTLVIENKLHNLWWFVLPWNARYTLVCIHWTTNSMIWDFERKCDLAVDLLCRTRKANSLRTRTLITDTGFHYQGNTLNLFKKTA